MDERLVRDYVKTVKAERRRKTTEKMGKILSACGRLVPKGIRSPDSMITNLHLYKPGVRGKKTRLR